MEEKDINIYLNHIKNSKKKIALIVGSISIITVIYSFIMPYTYESYSTIMPPSSSGSGGGLSSFLQNMSGGGLVLGGLGKSNTSLVYVDILSSYKNTEYIVDKLRLDTNSYFESVNKQELIYNLQKAFLITVEKSGVINISVELKTPFLPNDEDKEQLSSLSAKIVNACTEGLDNIMRNFTNSKAKLSRIYIENELDNYRIKLDSVSLALEEFQTDNKVLSLEDQTKAIVEQAITVQTELLTVGLELNMAKILYNENASEINTLSRQYNYLKQKSLDIQTGNESESEFAIPLNNVPKLMRIFRDLFRDKKTLEKVILYLETQRHQEAIQEKKDVPLVEILDKANKPEKRASPQRKLMLILAFILSSLISIFYIFIELYFREKK